MSIKSKLFLLAVAASAVGLAGCSDDDAAPARKRALAPADTVVMNAREALPGEQAE